MWASGGCRAVWPRVLAGEGWELAFRLQAQAGTQSLDAKATVSHGHGHRCGNPGKRDFPREVANETERQSFGGQCCIIKVYLATLQYRYVAKICHYLSSIFIR